MNFLAGIQSSDPKNVKRWDFFLIRGKFEEEKYTCLQCMKTCI
jgi:hypothetical protein